MRETAERYLGSPPGWAEPVRRLPQAGEMCIEMGTEVSVADDEVALVCVGASVGDVLGPGVHVIGTRSIPLSMRLLRRPYGSDAPLEGAITFVRPGVAHLRRWGTPEPVAFKDNMFGVTRVRAHGTITFSVNVPRVFVRTLGSPATPERLDAALRMLVACRLTDALAERLDTLIDLERNAGELREIVRGRLEADCLARGLTLRAFEVHALTVPRDVLSMLEARNTVGSVRRLRDFVRRGMLEALGRPGGASLGVSDAPLPIGPDEGAPSDRKRRCTACHALLDEGARFCSRCGEPGDGALSCLSCGQTAAPDGVFCQHCGTRIGSDVTCVSCATPAPPGSRFCRACGEQISCAGAEA